MASIAASWKMIEEVLYENAHSIFRALRKPATNAQLQRLTNSFGVKLPKDFVQSLRMHDGLQNSYLGPNRLFNYWAYLPISSILTAAKAMTDLQAECDFGGCQLDVSLQLKNDKHWRPKWLPFMDADGDKTIIDLDPGPKGKLGQVFVWSNSGSFPMRVVANSYREWLANVADRLSTRQFRLNESGQIWFDD